MVTTSSSMSIQCSPSGDTCVVSVTVAPGAASTVWKNQRASFAHAASNGSVAKSPDRTVFFSRTAVWELISMAVTNPWR